jgi:DNA-binding LacI/PurR family transcriptional regulator
MNKTAQACAEQAITMSDVARLAGVSKSTVSRALADSPLVNSQTRELIKSIARQHGYKVNLKARNFRLRQTHTIAVVIPLAHEAEQHISDPFFLDLLGSIADSLADSGYDLLLTKEATDRASWLADVVDTQRCDGVILIGQSSQQETIDQVAKDFRKLVVWGAQLPGQHYCTVGSDNRLGGAMAVRHLLGLGRRRIAFLGNKALPEIALRHAGWADALREAGIRPDPLLEVPAHFGANAAYRSMVALIENGTGFDAVFATSDVIAMAAIRAMSERGITVPDDVSVVGYDDITMAAYYTPALTTVRQDTATGGRRLVECLLATLRGETPASVMLPTELIVRRSCGAGESFAIAN